MPEAVGEVHAVCRDPIDAERLDQNGYPGCRIKLLIRALVIRLRLREHVSAGD